MKYYPIILLFAAILFTGCLDANNIDCVPVNQSSYLAEYAEREGYIKSESGLIYRVIEEGDGEIPQGNQYVFVKFTGKLVNGDTFEESEDLTFFPLSTNILSGLQEGLSLMQEGSTYELVIPPELAFGNNPPQGSIIQCGAVVIYEITLDSFLRDVVTFLEQNEAREDVEETDSGLQYRVIKEGEGETAKENSAVKVFYEGKLTNDYVFDPGTDDIPAEFSVSRVIDGFSEGLQLMNEGSIYQFFIPPGLAYGDDPPRDPRTGVQLLPPNAILIFEVEMVEIQ